MPALSAISGAEDATFRISSVSVTECRNENNVGILRVNGEAADVATVFESDRMPGFAGVGALVHAIALQDVVANAGFAGAYVDDVWVRLSYGDGYNGRELFLVRHRSPVQAAVGRLPHSTAHSAEIVGVGLTHDAGDREHAPAAKWSDEAPGKTLE